MKAAEQSQQNNQTGGECIMKRLGTIFLAIALIGLFLAPGVSWAGPKAVLKIGMVVTDKDPMYKGAMKMKELVESQTKGEIGIEVYPSSQLGDTKDVQVMAKMGSNIAALTDAGRLAEMVPEIGIMGAPYVVDDYDQALKLVTSDLWKSWEEKLAKQHGLRILSFNWYQGARHLLTKKPVSKPADLSGIRMRTPGSPIWQESIKAMGATPTAMAWAEVYPALQQGVIDGAEAQHPATYGAHLYEVVKFITKTGHFQLNTCLAVSEAWFNKLSPEQQKILLNAAFEGGKYASQETLSNLANYEKMMMKEGVTINEIDTTPFKEATLAVYGKVGLGDVKKQVQAQLAK
jgi:tripartite ATP-independent transporter DctP family solute receptor